MAYSNSPQTVSRDAVRLLVGDISTSTSGEWLANGDYDYFVAVTPNGYVAASLAAASLSALFAGAAASGVGASGYISKKVGDLELKKADAASMATSYRVLAAQMRRMSALGISPYAGGQSKDDKQTDRQDTDTVQPAFTHGGFDNPSVMSPGQSTST